jgi:hypothetical protein
VRYRGVLNGEGKQSFLRQGDPRGGSVVGLVPLCESSIGLTQTKHSFPTQELKNEGGLFEGVFGYHLVYYFLPYLRG